jgi:hypothetical protein
MGAVASSSKDGTHLPWAPSGGGGGAAVPRTSALLSPAGVTEVAQESVPTEAAQVTRVFFAGGAVTTRLRHWLCGAQTP